ncbi:MAG: hypothetical protein V3V14_11280, partial [Saprospiraceae bacterium]
TDVNGVFNISFVVPKDINYTIGKGRISYYAHDNDILDAAGYYNDVVIGGSSENIFNDNEGPAMKIYLNNLSFISGETVNLDPILLVDLSDDIGINVSGTSIGHDIVAVIDGDTKNSIILNGFYETALNDYTHGKVIYPLKGLLPGRHTLSVKAWDVSNNSTSGEIEFIIEENEESTLTNVYNYPNPFSNYTVFSFDHDLVGNELDITIDIFSDEGRFIESLHHQLYGHSPTINELKWDTSLATGKPVSKGIYFYKIKVEAKQLNRVRESKFEKLIKL